MDASANASRVKQKLPSHLVLQHVHEERGTGSKMAPCADPVFLDEFARLSEQNDIIGVPAPTAGGKSRYITGFVTKTIRSKQPQQKTFLLTTSKKAAESNVDALTKDLV